MATVSGSVQIEGLNKLLRQLEKAGVEISDLKTVFSELAREGAALTASLAPHKSGKLAASVRGNKSKNSAVIRAGGARVKYAGRVNYQAGFSATGYHLIQRVDDILAPSLPGKLDIAIARLIRQNGLAA